MRGHVSKRGSSWAYWFDIDPDPLTGKRRQQTKSGYTSEKEARKACRAAMADYEKGRLVRPSRRKVKDAMAEWLARIEHSIKPSMAQNWRNYTAYYVEPYIGDRAIQEINGAICDALYAKLLAEGRMKARPARRDRPINQCMFAGLLVMAACCPAVLTATTTSAATAPTPQTTARWASPSSRGSHLPRPLNAEIPA
jgi:hypothetical protein